MNLLLDLQGLAWINLAQNMVQFSTPFIDFQFRITDCILDHRSDKSSQLLSNSTLTKRWFIPTPNWLHSTCALGPYHCRGFKFTLRHTTIGRTPLDECSARRRNLYLKRNNTHKRQHPHPGEIRSRNYNNRGAVDVRLTLLGRRSPVKGQYLK